MGVEAITTKIINLSISPALAALLLLPLSALAEERFALVIGNGLYEEAPLDNPPRDAELIADTLRSLNFEVTLKKDVDQKTLKRLTRNFGRRLKGASDAVGLFYYSGHGMQIKGRNYIIPVDATINDEADVEIDSVRVDSILVRMEYAGPRLNIIVLDACRNNPFEKRFKSYKSYEQGKGLTIMQVSAGTLVAYATAPGNVADSGPIGGYSPFTETLAKELRTSSASVLELFNEVSVKVYKQTKRKQRPYIEVSVVPSFVFQSVEGRTPLEEIIGTADGTDRGENGQLILTRSEIGKWLEDYRQAYQAGDADAFVQLGAFTQKDAEKLVAHMADYKDDFRVEVEIIEIVNNKKTEATVTFKRVDIIDGDPRTFPSFTWILEKKNNGRIVRRD